MQYSPSGVTTPFKANTAPNKDPRPFSPQTQNPLLGLLIILVAGELDCGIEKRSIAGVWNLGERKSLLAWL